MDKDTGNLSSGPIPAKSLVKRQQARPLTDENEAKGSKQSGLAIGGPRVSMSDSNLSRIGKETMFPPINMNRNEGILDIQEILDIILPPREWDANGKRWVQQTSTTPATRQDLFNLLQKTETFLESQNAKPFGSCPVRRDIYNQLFDELIRQVTIECAERGLLLMRTRDELRLTVDTYRTLYESALAFGIRKVLDFEHRKLKAQENALALQQQNDLIKQEIAQIREQIEEAKKGNELEKKQIEQELFEENENLTSTNQQLKEKVRELVLPSISKS